MRELNSNNDLWNKHNIRTTFPGTPFAETADIWLRYGDDPATMAGPHFPVWYPGWERLPALHDVLRQIMGLFEPYHVGGILLTRMPRGSRILPHSDAGFWHPEFYSTKVYAILKANDKCVNHFTDSEGSENAVMKTGEIWWFNNLVTHSVENNGDSSRVAMIVCMRCE
jgi:hypothetical protein